MQEYDNNEFDIEFMKTQEVYQKIRSSGDTSGCEVAKLEHPKNKIAKESVEFSAEVADVECNHGRHGHHFNHVR